MRGLGQLKGLQVGGEGLQFPGKKEKQNFHPNARKIDPGCVYLNVLFPHQAPYLCMTSEEWLIDPGTMR